MRFQRQRRAAIHLNFTSLIDVLCVMVIFFMLTTKFLNYRVIGLDLGAAAQTGMRQSETKEIPSKPPFIIKVLKGGRVEINGFSMDVAMLQTYLKPRLLKDPEQEITIEPTKHIVVQDIISTIDRIRLAGGKHFTIAAGKS